jgi:hypothetical protein
MATKLPPGEDRRVYDAPLQVAHGADGSVTVFLPDGHRLVLSAKAAERSAEILWRAAVAQRARPRGRPARRSGEVIAVDFTAPGLHH